MGDSFGVPVGEDMTIDEGVLVCAFRGGIVTVDVIEAVGVEVERVTGWAFLPFRVMTTPATINISKMTANPKNRRPDATSLLRSGQLA